MPTPELHLDGDHQLKEEELLEVYELIVTATGAAEPRHRELFTAKLLLLCASRLGSVRDLQTLVDIARQDLPAEHDLETV